MRVTDRPTFDVRARLTVDLRRVLRRDPHRAARAIQEAASLPAGAVVTLQVPRGSVPPSMACAYLRQFGGDLAAVVIECDDPTTVRRWIRELNTGSGVGL